MSEAMQRAKMWVLMHPGLVVALVFVAIAVAAFVLTPDLGYAPRKPRP